MADDSEKLGEGVVEVTADNSKLKQTLEGSKAIVTKQLDDLGSKAGGMITKIAAGFTLGSLVEKGISGLVAFGSAAVENAGKLVDMSAKTGTSIEWLQRAGFVAKQTGSDIGSLNDAVFKLGINIAKGGEEVASGLGKMGLKLTDIQKLKPEEQFDAIAVALKGIENPQERNTAALQVFGKSAANILPAILDDYTRLKNEAPVTAEAQIQALDRAADRWDKFKDQVSSATASILGNMVIDVENASSGWSKFFGDVHATLTGGLQGHRDYIKSLQDQAAAADAAAQAEAARANGLKSNSTPAERDFSKELAESQAKLRSLTPEVRKQINAAIDLKASTKDIADQFNLTESQVELYKASLDKAKSSTKNLKDETKELADRVDQLANSMGKDVVRNGLAYAGALEKIGGVTKLTAKEQETFADALDDAMVKMKLLGTSAGPEFEKIRDAWEKVQTSIFNSKVKTGLGGGAWEDLLSGTAIDMNKFAAQGAKASYDAMQREFNKKFNKGLDLSSLMFGTQVKLAPPPGLFKTFGKALLADTFGKEGFGANLGPTILNALTGGGSVSKSVGALAGKEIGESVSKHFGSALTNSLPKMLGNAISSFLPGIGALIGPLISKGLGALGGLFTKAFGNNTKKAREEFAGQMGFDDLGSLYSDLQSLGDQGAALANVGMNIIGRNDEEGNRKWMEDVKKFYEDVKQKKEDAAHASDQALKDESDAYEFLQGAIEKYGFTIEELGPKWREQELNKMAGDLLKEYAALTASGIDQAVVISHMGDAFLEYAKTAKAAGVEIPLEMRNILQSLADQGKLLDENGQAITDLDKAGYKFSMTMSQGFQGVIDRLDKLISKITGELATGLESLPQPQIEIGVSYRYDDFTPPTLEPQVNQEGFSFDTPQLDKGGFANWGPNGTLVTVHNQEAIMPIDRLQELVAGGGSGGMTADELVGAMRAAGLDRPNVTIAPHLEGALASDMYNFAQMFIPWMTRVLQDNRAQAAGMAGALQVSAT